MNIIESVISRIHNFEIDYFDKLEGRRLRCFRNIYKDKRCFIIGNGPSLRVEDLNQISENNDISFAFNRIYHIFKDTKWRPTYYISQDVQILKSSKSEIKQMDVAQKFIPIQSRLYEGIVIPEAIYFNLSTKDSELDPSFSTDISKSISISKTVIYTAIQFAYYMGIKEIYLLGVDHHFRVSQNSKGEIIVDNSVKDYFTANYNKDLLESNWIPNTDESTLTYVAAKKYSELYGFKIYNATRGGMLEVFERRNFDELFPEKK